MIVPEWKGTLELMCDTSDFVAELHHEKEMLAVVFVFYKFRPYLIVTKVIVYTDHVVICYLFAKKNAKTRLISGYYYYKNLTSKSKTRRKVKSSGSSSISIGVRRQKRGRNPKRNIFR